MPYKIPLMEKISGVYSITNNKTGEMYIGSSSNIYVRWDYHKRIQYARKWQPDNRMYKEMEELGVEQFTFTILFQCQKEELLWWEQTFVNMLEPTYNRNITSICVPEDVKLANYKAYQKEYKSSEKYLKWQRAYNLTEERRLNKRLWKRKKDAMKCIYNGEEINYGKLVNKLKSAGVEHPTTVANQYIVE